MLQKQEGLVGQEVRPLYVASMFRVQGCKLAGRLLFLLLTQGPVTFPVLRCLVTEAQEVLQRQGAICGKCLLLVMPTLAQLWAFLLTSGTRSVANNHSSVQVPVSHSQGDSGCAG